MQELVFRVLVASSPDLESRNEFWADAACMAAARGAGMKKATMTQAEELHIGIARHLAAKCRQRAACGTGRCRRHIRSRNRLFRFAAGRGDTTFGGFPVPAKPL